MSKRYTIIEDIASSMSDDEIGMEVEAEPVVPEPEMGMDVDNGDDDLSSFVPKSHMDDMSGGGMDEMGGGGAGEMDEMGGTPSEETPIVDPGESNAAPPSPGSFAPAGVVKMDVPFLMKMLEHAKSGGDIHHLADQCVKGCSDPACSHLSMDHFDGIAAAVPATGMPGAEDGEMMGGMGGGADLPDGEIDTEGGLAPEIGEGGEGIEGEEPGSDPVGEAEGEEIGKEGEEEGGEDGPPIDDEPEGDEVDEDEGDDEGENEEDKDGPPFEEGANSFEDPLLEKFQGPNMQKIGDNKSDPVPAKSGKDKGKSGKKKPAFLKKIEKDEEDSPIAESMEKLMKKLSSKSKLVFRETNEKHITQFQIAPSPKLSKIMMESVDRALSNKKWLSDNGLSALTKYNRSMVINTKDMGNRHLVVLK